MPRHTKRKIADLRRRLYEILEHGPAGDHAGRVVGRLIGALIVVNLIAVTLESVPALAGKYSFLFVAIEAFSLIVFTAEYLLRLWVAAEHAPYSQAGANAARVRFALSPTGLIDLIAVLPFWFAMLLPADLRVIAVFRVVRFLKLARYSPGMRSLLDVLYAERRALTGCFVILIGATLISATAMHLVEGRVQPEKFGTIPDAMWWAIVTLGTIGYGDLVPITSGGRLIAAATIFAGLIMIALPVGIVATAFAEAIHRRDFVVTWSMIARVPLFAGLNAAEIADIMRLLQARMVEPGDVIVRRGEPAHSMYFIASGEVEVELPPPRPKLRLGEGHFFGEIAVLRRARRSGTITACRRSHLLLLDAHDLHALMERDPRIAERIHEIARTRLGRDLVSARGDLLPEELEDADDLYPDSEPVEGSRG